MIFVVCSKLKTPLSKIEAGYILGGIETNLKQIFGEIGGCVEIELLGLKENKKISLKVKEEDTNKVRVALTLLHNLRGISCHFKILRTSVIPIKEIS